MGPAASDRRVKPGRRAAWRLLAATAALSGVALAALPGVSGAASVSPAKWSQNVCQALVSYKKDGATIEKNAEKSLANARSLKAVRDKTAAFLQALAKRTDQAVRAIMKAGTPKVTNGAAVASGFQAGFAQIRDAFAQLVPQARQLPTNDPAQFQSSLMAIQTALQQADTQSQATFQNLTQLVPPDLDSVFKEQPACQKLG